MEKDITRPCVLVFSYLYVCACMCVCVRVWWIYGLVRVGRETKIET